MPKLTIDGKEYEAQDGQTIIEVCDQHHLNVPRFCYHPGLTVAGNCRICLVDVEKAPKPQIACGTPVAEGMVVHTDNDRARWARQGVMEFLLLNHPLDCPICDKAGECMLQWFSVEHGPGRSRLVGDKEHYAKKLDIGEHIVLDQERCILCSRCVRFTDEITRTHELAITERGVRAELNVVEGRRLDNTYSGCVTDICPVGALTLKEFRFKSRVWFLKDTASICPGCSRGCNVNVSVNTNMNVHGGRIERLLPRTNTAVNDYWMCDLGRLIFRDLYDKPRLRVPQARDGGELKPLSWDDAARAVWVRLREAADKGGPGSVAFVLSARATNEEIFLLRRLLGDLGSERLAFPAHVEGVDDGLLLNADRTPNRRGALEICGAAAVDGRGLEAIRQGLEERKIRALLVAGESALADGILAPALLQHLDTLVVLERSGATTMLERAHLVLPLAAWAEVEGTWTNCNGRVQRVRPAVRAVGEARPLWEVAVRIGKHAGWTERYPSPAEVLDAVAGAIPAFAGIDYAAIGLLGADLPGAAAAAGAR